MPPVGNFAVPASGTKEKRRRVPPSGNAVAESSRGNMGAGGPNNKVCLNKPLLSAPFNPVAVLDFV